MSRGDWITLAAAMVALLMVALLIGSAIVTAGSKCGC